ncbi:23S rRNA (guanosine(2251)-2'-O)-methyltransferase RlmB [Croceiramulus getboli]|nr:23S rRNA (guanosine(2251)-2'-O)-methyltransferase RlmB [Flavobacteriaceae bacterium YJPT1-3]
MIQKEIYGTRSIIEAIKAGKEITKIFLQRGSASNALTQELEQLIKKEQISVAYVPVQKLDRLTKKNHQGAYATISPIRFMDLETLVERSLNASQTPLLLILDQLTDARNFGAIIRTAACTGVQGIIIQKSGGAPVNADTVKTSAGGLFHVPICRVDHIKDALFYLQGSGIKTIAATEKASQTVYENDLTAPLALIMGSEGKGVSHGVLKTADELVKLPMTGPIESLNVSVACGAFLYEIVRQRLS